MSLGASFTHLYNEDISAVDRQEDSICSGLRMHHLISHSQNPFQVETHFTDAETDSMPAQRPLRTLQALPPATPRECHPSQPCGIGWEWGFGWHPGRKLPHHGAPNPSKKVNSQLLCSHCKLQGTLGIPRE